MPPEIITLHPVVNLKGGVIWVEPAEAARQQAQINEQADAIFNGFREHPFLMTLAAGLSVWGVASFARWAEREERKQLAQRRRTRTLRWNRLLRDLGALDRLTRRRKAS